MKGLYYKLNEALYFSQSFSMDCHCDVINKGHVKVGVTWDFVGVSKGAAVRGHSQPNGFGFLLEFRMHVMQDQTHDQVEQQVSQRVARPGPPRGVANSLNPLHGEEGIMHAVLDQLLGVS